MKISELTVNKTGLSDIELSPKDPRFRNPAFRLAVRTVLLDLGYDSTYSSFKKFDGIIDFEEYYKNLKCPEFSATCFVLDGNGGRIRDEDKKDILGRNALRLLKLET